jgi:transcriptional regulator with XRE-family HTH domain
MEIKVTMVRAGVTGRELARRLGTSQTWVSTRLNGTTPLDLNELQRIANALGVGIIDLLRPTLKESKDAPRPNGGPTSAVSARRHLTTRPLSSFRVDLTRPSSVPPNRRRPFPVRPGDRSMAA